MKKFGDKVKKYRTLARLTQEQLAEKCDCSCQTISGIETGYSFPSFSLLLKLSEILNVPLAYFFSYEKISERNTTTISAQLTEIFGNLNEEQQEILLKLMKHMKEMV